MQHPSADSLRLNCAHRSAIQIWASFVITAIMSLTHSACAERINERSHNRPNVLMIAVDDLRPMLGCYGNQVVKTPNIDRLARQSVLFERAYCQIAKCGPSRLSLLTGLRPDTTKVYDHRASDLKRFRENNEGHVSLPRCFTDAGYVTQSFGKVYHDGWDIDSDWSEPRQPGRDNEMLAVADLDAISKVQFADRATVPTVIQDRDDCPAIQSPDVPDDGLFAGQMTAKVIEVLSQSKDKPFFLAVGYRRPHLPFVAPKRYFDLYDPQTSWLPSNRNPPRDAPIMAHFNSDGYVGFAKRVGLTMPNPPKTVAEAKEWAGFELRSYKGVPYHGTIDDELQLRLRQAYMACVSYVDAQIGRLLDELNRLNLDDSMIVVLWSDHGWHLGEHASWGKMTNYELDTRVPLLFRSPGCKPRKTQQIVELVDIYPTLRELCDIDSSQRLDGWSLVPVLNGNEVVDSKPAFSQFTRFKQYMGRAIRTDQYRYVQWSSIRDGEVVARELYDHKTDSGETVNVASDPDHQSRIARWDELLEKDKP